jgi:PAS domain S-box-containing protein
MNISAQTPDFCFYLKALHDNSDFGIVCLDADMQILSWNPWLAERTGIRAESAIGKPLSRLIPHTPPITIEACSQCLASGMPRILSPVLHQELIPFIRPSRQTGRFFPAFDNNGTCIGAILLLHDATPALDFEAFVQNRVLCEQKEREDIFNAMAHPAFILGPDQRILDVNASMVRLLKLQPEDIIGKACYSLVHGADRPIDGCPMSQMSRTGTHQQHEIYLENLEKHFIVSCTPIFDESGTLSKAIHIAMDVTEQKRMEAELKRSEERYRAFVKQSSEAICLFEIEPSQIEPTLSVEEQIDLLYAHAVIRECNRVFATSHGYSDPVEMTGFRIGMVFPRLAPENIAYLRSFIENGYTISGVETKEITRDGSVRYFLNSLIGHTESGRLLRIWGAKQDITRIKRVEAEIRKLNEELERRVADRTAELAAANRELEAFAYSVSHDLRAPLRAIEGYSRMLSEDHVERLGEEGIRICAVIQQNARNLRDLINDLLAFSRTTTIEMQRYPVDMKAMAYSIYHEATTPKDRERIDFILQDVTKAQGDPTLMRQLWMNLISNAVKFSGKRERAIIEIGYDTVTGPSGLPQQAYFIRDNGAGFDMNEAKRLFQPFQRLHRVTEFEGTGMGLPMVQRIIHRHGGSIWGYGEPERGAVFYFTLDHPLTNSQEIED